MSEAINSKEILYELKAIREDLDYIKGHMVDIDSILTEEDYLSIQEYRKEKASGILTSHAMVELNATGRFSRADTAFLRTHHAIRRVPIRYE